MDDDGEMGWLFRTFIEPEDHRAILIPAYHEIWPVICWVPPNTNLTGVQIQGRQTIGVVRQVWQDEELAHIIRIDRLGEGLPPAMLVGRSDLFVRKPSSPDRGVEKVFGLLEHWFRFGFE